MHLATLANERDVSLAPLALDPGAPFPTLEQVCQAPLAPPVAERLRLHLRFRQPVHLRFRHEGAVHGLLSRALGHEALAHVMPFAVESGRVRYDAGNGYVIGLSLLDAPDRPDVDAIVGAVARVGRSGARPERRPSLAGNFEVERVVRLGPPTIRDVGREVEALRARTTACLRFVSPLRLKLPQERGARGGGFFDDRSFPADVFLQRLWQRLVFVATGAYPDPRSLPRPPASVTADPSRLTWVDLPILGQPGRRTDRPRGMTVGGVVGEVRLDGLDPAWATMVALGRHLHLGSNVRYGFGRYDLVLPRLAGLEGFEPDSTLLGQVARWSCLAAARDALAREAERFGSAPVRAELEAESVEAVIDALQQGTYRCEAQRPQIVLAGGEGKSTAPTRARDRIVQRAVVDVLTPSIETWLDSTGFAFHHGLSRASAGRTLRDAWHEGYRLALDLELAALLDEDRWHICLSRLKTLLPGEPLVALLRRWLFVATQPLDPTPHAAADHPVLDPRLTSLIARLDLPTLDSALRVHDLRLTRLHDRYLVLLRDPAAIQCAVSRFHANLASLRRLERLDRANVVYRLVPLTAEVGVVGER